MTPLWVVGGSGLIGSAVVRAGLRAGRPVRTLRGRWTGSAREQIAALGAEVERLEAVDPGVPADVVWVAGAGVVGTSVEALDTEAAVVGAFLDHLEGRCAAGRAPRAMFVASSAGAVHAGAAGAPFTERSAVVPLAPYGHQKVAIEGRTHAFARRTGVPTMIGRITNAYGPGQDLAKPQGLISQLGQAFLLHRPLSVYVSLDTIRDYLFVDDGAQMIMAALAGLPDRAPHGAALVKIIGSGLPVTIAMIIGEYRRLLRRRPPVVLGESPDRRFQVRDLRMRSVVWPELNRVATTPLPAGIGVTLADLSARLRTGQLVSAR